MSDARPYALDAYRDRLRAVADRTSRWVFGTWYWGDAIAIDGLLAADRVGAGSYRPGVIQCIDRWALQAPPSFDDALAPGAAIFELVHQDELDPAAGERAARAVERLPLLDGLVPALEPHRPSFRFGVCIDALYHLPVTVRLARRFRGDDDAGLLACRMTARILELLLCPGGWAHWYDYARGRNNAIVWSRGLGWALLGVLDLLEVCDAAAAAGLLQDAAGRILELLCATSSHAGLWPAVLGDEPADTETSTSAFFVAGALHPQAARIGRPASEMIESATRALLGAIGPDGILTGASADVLPCWDLHSYEHVTIEPSPWSQGAAMRALAALVGSEESRIADSAPSHDPHRARTTQGTP